MFEIDDRIAVAVSGGKDSISLLHIMVKIERGFPKSSLCAITVDEGIEGYRNEATRMAAENCVNLGVEQITVSFQELYGYSMDEIVEKTQQDKLTPCAYCGVLRRQALNIAARRVNADKIVTAHNLDDEVQTFLLNIVRGNPLRSVRLDHVSDLKVHGLIPRTKPFREVLEREVALYAYIKQISFQEIPCPYAGQALRNDIRDTLNRLEKKHPGMKYSSHGSMGKIRETMKGRVKGMPLNECKNCREPTTGIECQTCQLLENLKTQRVL
jgi:uncharacterized protein (TIGR00269 family)